LTASAGRASGAPGRPTVPRPAAEGAAPDVGALVKEAR
jgi:hypothetical protein